MLQIGGNSELATIRPQPTIRPELLFNGMLGSAINIPCMETYTPIWAIFRPSSPTRLLFLKLHDRMVRLVHRDAAHRQRKRAQVDIISGGVALTDHFVEVLRDRIPYILFGTVFLFIGLCVCGTALMRRRSGGTFFTWLGIWSAIEGTEYLFGSLADLGLLPHWVLAILPYVGNILSFSVVVIALLAFLDLSQDKLRLFLQGAIVAGLAIAVAGVALFLLTGSSFKIMPFNHLLAAVSLTILAIVVAVPNLSRRFLVLPNRTVLSLGILLFALEAVYGNLSLPLRLPSPPEILDPLGFAVLLFCFGYVAVRSLESSSSPSAGF